VTDSLSGILLLLGFVAVMAAGRFFKTLDGAFWRAAGTPFAAGLIAGVVIAYVPLPRFVAVGLTITLASLYVRLTGEESEPTDGMILGAITGAAAAFPLVFLLDEEELRAMAECLLAGAVAGYGITFASLHVGEKLRQLMLDGVTAILAVGAAYLPSLGRSDRVTAIAVAAALPLIVVITVLQQWPDMRAELRHEASLGFIDDADVRPTAHPLLRLGRGGWADPGAHREFVRLANKIALRKRKQRNRPDETARLYQLEIIKLRMQLQEMSRINRDTRRGGAPEAHQV